MFYRKYSRLLEKVAHDQLLNLIVLFNLYKSSLEDFVKIFKKPRISSQTYDVNVRPAI